MKSSQGYRKKTRQKIQAHVKDKFTPNIYLRTFHVGQQVAIKPYAPSQKGMPFPKYTGLIGTITEKRGQAYMVTFLDSGKKKTLSARPEHLKAV